MRNRIFILAALLFMAVALVVSAQEPESVPITDKNIEEIEFLGRISEYPSFIHAVAFLPGTDSLVVHSEESYVIDISDGTRSPFVSGCVQLLVAPDIQNPDAYVTCDLDSEGHMVLVSVDGERRDIVLDTLIREDNLERLAISPTGRYFAAVTLDKSIFQLWSLETGEVFELYVTDSQRRAPISALAFSAEDEYLAVNSVEALILYDLGGTPQKIITEIGLNATQMLFSPEGLYLIGVGDQHLSWVWDIRRETLAMTLHGYVLTAVFNPVSQMLVILDTNGIQVIAYEPDFVGWGRPVPLRTLFDSQPVFSPDGSLLFLVQREVEVWGFDARGLVSYFGNPLSRDAALALGKQLYTEMVCDACHAYDDEQESLGPDFQEMIENAADRVPDMSAEEYLWQSIVNPNAFIVEGYSPNIHPLVFGDRMSPTELDALVAYLVSQHEIVIQEQP